MADATLPAFTKSQKAKRKFRSAFPCAWHWRKAEPFACESGNRMNLLQNGLQWLSEKQSKHVSSEALYCRDENTYVVNAVLGRTRYEIVDENGFKIAGHAIDFLIAASDLPLEPKVGDKILCENIVHEVIDLGGDGCWSWCDPHGIRRRIHTEVYRL